MCIARGGRVEWERWEGGAGEVGGWNGRGGRVEWEMWEGGMGKVGGWSGRGGRVERGHGHRVVLVEVFNLGMTM